MNCLFGHTWNKWQVKEKTIQRYDMIGMKMVVDMEGEPINIKKRFQERECAKCGFIQQREIE